MRRALASATVLSLLALASPARAEDAEHFALRVESVAGCPTEAEVRDAVAARLGFDGFDPSGTSITVTFAREGAGYAALVRVGERAGPTRRASACRDLLAPTAVTLAVILDPLGTRSRTAPASPSAASPSAASPSAPVPVPEPPAPPSPPVPVPEPPAPAPSLLEVSAGPFLATGRVPDLTAGAELALAWRRARRGPSLALDATLPASTSRGSATVTGQLASASVLPCLDVGPLTPCARLQAGALFGRGEGISRPRVDRSGYMAAGVRIGARWNVAAAWVVSIHADVDVQITRAALEIDGMTLWRAPLFAGGLGAAVGFQR